LRLQFLQTHASSNSFYTLVTVHCKGKKKENLIETIPPSLWVKKSIQKTQVQEISRLCTETSTKLCFHEFGFCSGRSAVAATQSHMEFSFFTKIFITHRVES
jgi:hypothetical protein